VYGVCMVLPYSMLHAPYSLQNHPNHAKRCGTPTGLTIRSIRRTFRKGGREESLSDATPLGALLQSSSPILAGSTARNNAKPSCRSCFCSSPDRVGYLPPNDPSPSPSQSSPGERSPSSLPCPSHPSGPPLVWTRDSPGLTTTNRKGKGQGPSAPALPLSRLARELILTSLRPRSRDYSIQSYYSLLPSLFLLCVAHCLLSLFPPRA
jgi:hypothetical protein